MKKYYIMKKLILTLLKKTVIALTTFVFVEGHAEMFPNQGIEVTGTLPVIYINTIDNTVIDQKEVYIDATAWIDDNGTGKCGNVGSADEPLILGIRGRGNASWNAEGPKPYKLKFDKKQSFFGLTKNKHWVLLPVSTYSEYYNNKIGLEIGRRLGMNYLPQRFPVELVLNGVNVGMYQLSEHIRVDEGRVDIYEQPDLNEDETTIPYGWLVEIDNYTDPCQIQIPRPDVADAFTRITYHTPEILSPQQEKWLYDQFNSLAQAVYTTNKLDRGWESIVDIDDLVKYFLVQEIIHNFDAFVGSCYLNKDIEEEKWHFGPLWDLGWSLDREISTLVSEGDLDRQQQYICEIIKFPHFRKLAQEKFNQYIEENPSDWVKSFTDSLYVEVKAAMNQTKLIWPELKPVNDGSIASGFYNSNIEFLKNYFSKNFNVHTLRVDVQHITAAGQLPDKMRDGSVLINGLELNEVDVNTGESLTLQFVTHYGKSVEEVTINGVDMLKHIKGNELLLDNIDEDMDIVVVFGLAPDSDAVGEEPGDESATIKDRLYLDPFMNLNILDMYNITDVERWTSSKSNILPVSSSGVLRALGYGESVIRAKNANGETLALLEVYVCPRIFIESGNGLVSSLPVLYNSRPDIYLLSSSEYRIAGVVHDGVDVTRNVIAHNGIYSLDEPVCADTHINISLERNDGTYAAVSTTGIKVLVDGHTVTILGAQPGALVTIVNAAGHTVEKGRKTTILLNEAGVYMLTIEGVPTNYKIMVR